MQAVWWSRGNNGFNTFIGNNLGQITYGRFYPIFSSIWNKIVTSNPKQYLFQKRGVLLLNNTRNTIVYEQDEGLHEQVLKVFSTAHSVDAIEGDLHELMCCLPHVKAPGLAYSNLFRIIIMNFMDAYDFDVRAIKKSCVHIVHKDGRIIPFETMNLFYREAEQEAYMQTLLDYPI